MGKRVFEAPQLKEYGLLADLTGGGDNTIKGNPEHPPQGCDNIVDPGTQAKIAEFGDACFTYGSS